MDTVTKQAGGDTLALGFRAVVHIWKKKKGTSNGAQADEEKNRNFPTIIANGKRV